MCQYRQTKGRKKNIRNIKMQKQTETNERIRQCVTGVTEQIKTNKSISEGDEQKMCFVSFIFEELTFQVSHTHSAQREKMNEVLSSIVRRLLMTCSQATSVCSCCSNLSHLQNTEF